MRDFRLEFSPFSFVALQEGIVYKQANEHSTAYVKGIIHHSDFESYRELSVRDQHLPFTITAIGSEEETVTVFQGVTTCIRLQKTGNVTTMTIEAKSGSYLMDIFERFRSFQDESLTHSVVLEQIGQPYMDYSYILKTGTGEPVVASGSVTQVIQDMPLKQFTVQYWETDWAFAKRLASRLGTCLVPADTAEGVKFYFGVPHLAAHVLDDTTDYEIKKDYTVADDKKRYGLEDAGEIDAISYLVRLRDIYQIGDLVEFLGMHLYVACAETVLHGQELMHCYHLRPRHGLRTARYQNDRMIGASLDAQVVAVERDEVQVQITEDQNTEQKLVKWFPFATVYSSPDGTGWYCMPEIGDQVRVYIPNNEEAHAVVFNALHVASGARNNPDIKSMRTKHGKEIRFTPNTLVMTNNTGMEISIIDNEGIRIDSNRNIFIKADGNIDISSGAGLSMLAADSVVVQQGGTSLVIDDNIAFVGGKLRMQ